MENKIFTKKFFLIIIVVIAIGIGIGISLAFLEEKEELATGFYIEGNTLYDATGEEFVMRGVNHGHSWYKEELFSVIPAVAETRANSIRLVLSDGSRWTRDHVSSINNILTLTEANNLVAILEVHDATGRDDMDSLMHAVDYWIEIKEVLLEREDTVIINIANEWFGSWSGSQWADGYKQAIQRLRQAGFTHTLMIDAAGWGQYAQSVHDYGVEVLEADPLRNIIFSIHMYEYAGGDAETIKANIDKTLDQELALVIGEFGHRHHDGDVDEATILSYAEEKGVGWLAWSWKGNSDDVAYLDLSHDWTGNNPTEWGKTIIHGPNGIAETSKISNVYK